MPDSPVPVAYRFRWGLYLPVGLLALVAIAWTGIWFYAAREVNRAIDAWLLDQHQQGQEWTCPERSLKGFPFRIELNCTGPTFAGEAGMGKMAGLHAVALVYQPDRAIVQLDQPLQFRAANGTQVQVAWEDFRLSLAGLPGAGAHADAVVLRPVISSLANELAIPRASANRVEVHLRRTPDRAAVDRAIDVAMEVNAIASEMLDGAAQNKALADIALRATLTQARPGNDETLPQWLEAWRTAGGAWELASAQINKGDIKLNASGQLGLDESHRMRGQIALEAAGLEPVLARLGVPSAALNVGGLLSGLLGGGKSKATSPNGTQLSFTLANGRVSMGPIKLPVTLVPLY